MSHKDVSNDEILAYIDGALPADRCHVVEVYLTKNPDARDFVAAAERQNKMLRTALLPIMDAPVPAGLPDAAMIQRLPRWVELMKIAAVLLAGFVAGFYSDTLVQPKDRPSDLIAKVELAHQIYAQDNAYPVEYWADNQTVLQAWFSARMDAEIKVPSFAEIGFDLVGGRLMMGTKKPAALLVFEADDKRRIALYIRLDMPLTAEQKVNTQVNGKLRMTAWQEQQNGYAISGPLTAHEMLKAAALVKVHNS